MGFKWVREYSPRPYFGSFRYGCHLQGADSHCLAEGALLKLQGDD